MPADIGEYIVGAYLKMIKECQFVDYGVRIPGGGLEGLDEIDVVALNFKSDTAYLCEVTTHIRGVLYGTYEVTYNRINKKYERLRGYGKKHLKQFSKKHYMFWSPLVPEGKLSKRLRDIGGLELVINKTYTAKVEELRRLARSTTHQSGNPFFRMLQIVEHLKYN